MLSLTLLMCKSTNANNNGNNMKNDCDPTLCSRVRCYNVPPEACDPNSERYVKRDGNCYCCDTCVPID